MAKVKVDLPEKSLFSTELDVRIGDINYGGHMGNDVVLAMCHEARIRFFKEMGFSEGDVGGVGIIMRDAAVVYKSEAFHGERLNVELFMGEFSRCGCDLYYRLENVANGDEVARTKTGIVFFDYTNRKIVACPSGFRGRFA